MQAGCQGGTNVALSISLANAAVVAGKDLNACQAVWVESLARCQSKGVMECAWPNALHTLPLAWDCWTIHCGHPSWHCRPALCEQL